MEVPFLQAALFKSLGKDLFTEFLRDLQPDVYYLVILVAVLVFYKLIKVDREAATDAVEIKPGSLVMIPTGIAIELPEKDLAAFLFARSGLGVKHGICLANGVGVIDSDYRGEICVGLCNVSDKDYTVSPGERIAQMVIMPAVCAEFVQVQQLGETERGSGGFGSTGKV